MNTTEIIKPESGYREMRCNTYIVMLRQAILYLRPDIDQSELMTQSKSDLRRIWCHIMNNQ